YKSKFTISSNDKHELLIRVLRIMKSISSEDMKNKTDEDNHAIIMRNVTVTKSGKNLIEDVSFYADKGEILGIIGASGAGKTTSLRVLTGQLQPSSGQALVLGMDVTNSKNLETIKMRTGFVPQLGSQEDVYLELNAIQNAIHFGRMYQLPTSLIKERTRKILTVLGFEDEALIKKKAKDLSGGELKRVSIAVGLVHDPDILFLDEPTTGLDPTLRIEVLNFLKHLNKTMNVTIVIVSHDLETASYCDKIVILKNGHVIDFGNPAEMIKSLTEGKAARVMLKKHLPSSKIFKKILNLPNVQHVLKTGRKTFKIFATNLPDSLSDLMSGLEEVGLKDKIQTILMDKIIFMDYFQIKMQES
ncbi:MAG: ABC transporter ATP-binding protein, partial [Candidatus Helarchaeales archaeon]